MSESSNDISVVVTPVLLLPMLIIFHSLYPRSLVNLDSVRRFRLLRLHVTNIGICTLNRRNYHRARSETTSFLFQLLESFREKRFPSKFDYFFFFDIWQFCVYFSIIFLIS